MDKKEVYTHINKYAVSSDLKALTFLVPTLFLYVGGFYLPVWMIPLHSLFFLRLFVCMHDMGHKYFFKTKLLNIIFGYICSTLVFTPFTYWVRGHNFHHRHSNDLDHTQLSQSAPFTVKQYQAWPNLYKRVYRFVTYPVIFISVVSPLYLSVYNPVIPSMFGEKLLLCFYIYILWSTGNLARLFCTGVLATSFGAFLFHLQHTYKDAKRGSKIDHFDSALYGASFLQVPWFLCWATGSIEYHHIHHLSTAVPLYNLRKCHDEAPPEMFKDVKRITLEEGIDSLKYALYDEEKDRLVTLDEV